MKVGVLSDTHDRSEPTRQAVELLQDLEAEVLVHCGDVCTESILDLFVGTLPTYFVFGNNEPDPPRLAAYAKILGLHCLGPGGILVLGGKRFGVTHGDQNKLVRDLLQAEVDYLLTGHTHIAHDQLQGRTRWVNPGAIHRTRQRSVAVIDTEHDAVKFHPF